MNVEEGKIDFRGFKTWYRIVDANEQTGKLPLLCLHGGPGATHDYLESLESLEVLEVLEVLNYHQQGCYSR